ncbi:hypothetical protein [Bartonella apihabitans]|uniref:hypothetical protein n=1 Tax=Bartonella apihabitans TaxID=2750929 RepID=UPI00122E83BA|nr:hypothetical protein [Bartonella apihabitans]
MLLLPLAGFDGASRLNPFCRKPVCRKSFFRLKPFECTSERPSGARRDMHLISLKKFAGQNLERKNNGVQYFTTTRSMMVIDHNEILFRLKNDNFLDGRQVFNFSAYLFYPVNVLQGTGQV